jgi:hypothetical protein
MTTTRTDDGDTSYSRKVVLSTREISLTALIEAPDCQVRSKAKIWTLANRKVKQKL